MSTTTENRNAFQALAAGKDRNEIFRAWGGPPEANVAFLVGTLAGSLLADTDVNPTLYAYVADGTMRCNGFITAGWANTGASTSNLRKVEVKAISGTLVDANSDITN